MKKTMLWFILFATGLLMVLFRMEISRFISELTSLLAAGCILAAVAGAGLLIELYRKRSEDI